MAKANNLREFIAEFPRLTWRIRTDLAAPKGEIVYEAECAGKAICFSAPYMPKEDQPKLLERVRMWLERAPTLRNYL